MGLDCVVSRVKGEVTLKYHTVFGIVTVFCIKTRQPKALVTRHYRLITGTVMKRQDSWSGRFSTRKPVVDLTDNYPPFTYSSLMGIFAV